MPCIRHSSFLAACRRYSQSWILCNCRAESKAVSVIAREQGRGGQRWLVASSSMMMNKGGNIKGGDSPATYRGTSCQFPSTSLTSSPRDDPAGKSVMRLISWFAQTSATSFKTKRLHRSPSSSSPPPHPLSLKRSDTKTIIRLHAALSFPCSHADLVCCSSYGAWPHLLHFAVELLFYFRKGRIPEDPALHSHQISQAGVIDALVHTFPENRSSKFYITSFFANPSD